MTSQPTTREPIAWGIEFEGSTTIEVVESRGAAEALVRHLGATGEEVDVVSRIETGPWRYQDNHVAAGDGKPVAEHNHAWAWTGEFDGPQEKEACPCGKTQWVE